ncbi:MAG TPA: hypothetical protein VM143_04750 [Acidimicrobiales bacterium]|nr:hypothetical protein [Acidimicrobiales bacterium]
MRRLVVVLIAVASIGACADDPPAVETGATTTTTTTPAATSSTTTGAAGFATTTVSTPPEKRGLLKDVGATAAGDVDRVIFTFEGDLPGYRVGFVDRPVIQDGSGEEVTVDGESVLQVHFEPASGFDLAGEGRQVYTGPTRLDLATRTVLDVVRTGDFEANLEWVLGLGTKAPFKVRTESSPNRVIVEVRVSP